MLPQWERLWQTTLGWSPSSDQHQQLETLYQDILRANQKFNLTRITEPEAFWEKHIWDSLRGIMPVLFPSHQKVSLIDIGTGAGFPGLPCAIALPGAHLTLLDATAKKIAYLNTLIPKLGLTQQVIAFTGRAETMGQFPQHYQSYDYALLRAVAPAERCATYAFPFLKVGGIAVLYRGHWCSQQETTLQQTLAELGGCIWHIDGFLTPLTSSERHCVYLKKTHSFV